MNFEDKVRCNDCMKEFFENEIIYDEALDKECCPYCGKSGCLMGMKSITIDDVVRRLNDGLNRTEEELKMIQEKLKIVEFDDYDRLIQLCDSLATGEAIMTIEDRMNDVKNRYGFYPKSKWNKNLEIKAYFEQKIGKDIYSVIEKN